MRWFTPRWIKIQTFQFHHSSIKYIKKSTWNMRNSTVKKLKWSYSNAVYISAYHFFTHILDVRPLNMWQAPLQSIVRKNNDPFLFDESRLRGCIGTCNFLCCRELVTDFLCSLQFVNELLYENLVYTLRWWYETSELLKKSVNDDFGENLVKMKNICSTLLLRTLLHHR